MTLRDRIPWVTGSFYESTASSLKNQLDWCFTHKVGPGSLPEEKGEVLSSRRAVSIISPHAGYIYSGPVAAHGYFNLAHEPVPDIVAILGPNHTGEGAGVSVWGDGSWETPLGKLQLEGDAARGLQELGVAEEDQQAHIHEHSIEVQLPFLQYIYKKSFRILPICMMLQDCETSVELGTALATVLAEKSAVLVASTDFSHYEPYKVAYAKDSLVSEAILAMDAGKVEQTVAKNGISMCGPGPVMAAITASSKLGAKTCRKLCYATSGDTSGSKAEVVGYGSFMMSR